VKARYVMIGGFLGAGKTTAVSKLARRLDGHAGLTHLRACEKKERTPACSRFLFWARNERSACSLSATGQASDAAQDEKMRKMAGGHFFHKL